MINIKLIYMEAWLTMWGQTSKNAEANRITELKHTRHVKVNERVRNTKLFKKKIV